MVCDHKFDYVILGLRMAVQDARNFPNIEYQPEIQRIMKEFSQCFTSGKLRKEDVPCSITITSAIKIVLASLLSRKTDNLEFLQTTFQSFHRGLKIAPFSDVDEAILGYIASYYAKYDTSHWRNRLVGMKLENAPQLSVKFSIFWCLKPIMLIV
jgi:hypothetical protein